MSSFVLFLVIAQCVSAGVFFSPSTNVVKICAGENITLKCATNTGTLVWHVHRVKSYVTTFDVHSSDNPEAPLGDHITVYLTSVSGSYITSVANITRAPLALNGTVIQCIDRSGEEMGAHPVGNEKALLVSAITDLRFTALSFTSASIEWAVPAHCGNKFTAYIIQISKSSRSPLKKTTSLTTSVNVTDLSQGVEYNVSVIGISDENSTVEGMYHALINMTLDVAERVTGLVVESLCHHYVENAFIFVSFKQSSSSRPPAVRYIIQYYKDDDDYGYYDHDEVDDDDVFQMTANLTYIVIKVVPGRWYVKVAAVNVLGPSLYNKRYWPPYSRNVHVYDCHLYNIYAVNTSPNLYLVFTIMVPVMILLYVLLATLCAIAIAVYIIYRYKKDRRCRVHVGATERESGDIPEEGQRETAGVINDQPEQAASGEEFAMTDDMSYSTVSDDKIVAEDED